MKMVCSLNYDVAKKLRQEAPNSPFLGAVLAFIVDNLAHFNGYAGPELIELCQMAKFFKQFENEPEGKVEQMIDQIIRREETMQASEKKACPNLSNCGTCWEKDPLRVDACAKEIRRQTEQHN